MDNNTQIITVALGKRSYPVLIGAGLLKQEGILLSYISGSQILIVSQQRIAQHYLKCLQAHFTHYQCDHLLLPDGENFKSLATVSSIFDELLVHGHHRDTTLIALGGGVIGDMTGFAAACYQRGVNFIQVPTTLLAQVDASIGGKTGVNHPLGKNMIGAIYQPRCVMIDVDTLSTLDEREYKAGLAEVIKSALLMDAVFFKWCEENSEKILIRDKTTLIKLITRCCEIKAQIVAQDEKDYGMRMLLNLGHTFAHAIETETEYKIWLHGEAVAIGLIMAADLSNRLGWLNSSEFQRIKALIKCLGLPWHLSGKSTVEAYLSRMAVDKKNQNSKLRLILLRAIGSAEIVTDVPLDLLTQTLQSHFTTHDL